MTFRKHGKGASSRSKQMLWALPWVKMGWGPLHTLGSCFKKASSGLDLFSEEGKLERQSRTEEKWSLNPLSTDQVLIPYQRLALA
jgi:hypothetical protein